MAGDKIVPIDGFTDIGERYVDLGDGTFVKPSATSPQVVILGKRKVGATAVAKPAPGWAWTAGNWTNDGVDISGETNPAGYVRKAADAGKVLGFRPTNPVQVGYGGATEIGTPSAPVAPVLTAIAGGVSAAYTAVSSANNGGAAITKYGVRLSDGSYNEGTASPIVVTSESRDPVTAYVFAINSAGDGDRSPISNAVTPIRLTKPVTPAAPVLTAAANAISIVYTVPADGGSAISEAQFVGSDGVTTTLTGSPQVIAKPKGVPINGVVRFRNAIGWSDPSPRSNEVIPTDATVNTYTYKQLPSASGTPQQTRAMVSDWPGSPNRQMINNGGNWEPYPVAKVRQHVNTRDGCGGNNNSVASNGTQNSFNQAYGIKVTGVCEAIKILFSNYAKASGGTTVIPGLQAMTIESSFTVGGVKSRNLWAGAAVSRTLQPGDEVWADADASVTLTNNQIVSLNQHVVYPSVPTSLPCQNANGLMATAGDYVSYDAAARGVDLPDLTMGTMPTGKIPQGALQVPKAITALTDYKPVVILLGDSNRLWARQALQSAGIRWVDFGMDGWTLQALATDDTSTQFRFTHLADMGVTHALVTMAGGDVTAGRTVAQIIGYKNTIQAKFEALGIIPIFCTTPPKTTDNETAVIDSAKWTAIQGYNAEIRTNNKYGFVELFDQVGDRTTGLWLPPSPSPLSTVGDGVHMTLAVHAVATAGVLPQLPTLFKQG